MVIWSVKNEFSTIVMGIVLEIESDLIEGTSKNLFLLVPKINYGSFYLPKLFFYDTFVGVFE